MSDSQLAPDGATDTRGLKDRAMDWAARGWRVFPLAPGRKEPLPGSHGFKDATDDPRTVEDWWARWPCANAGIATGSGLVVLDVDVKGEKNGFLALAKVGLTKEKLDGLRTFRVGTPSGGVHYYFRADAPVKSGTDVLGAGCGVDVRGEGGYVVAPPSMVGGKAYVPNADGVPVLSQLPRWEAAVAPFLPVREVAPPPPPPAPAARPSAPAEKDVTARAEAYLRAIPPAISGQGGHNATLALASTLVNGFELDEGTALRLMMGEWNGRCVPPWSEKELRHKIGDAARLGPPSGKVRGWLLGEEAEEGEEDADADTPQRVPIRWENVGWPPGGLGVLARAIFKTQKAHSRPAAILAALLIAAVCAGRKIAVDGDNFPILFVLYLTPTGNGKRRLNSAVETVLRRAGVGDDHILGGVSSFNAGFERLWAVRFHPVLLLQMDEAVQYLANAKNAAQGRGGTTGADSLQRLFTLAFDGDCLRNVSTLQSGGRRVDHPAMNLFWTVQPLTFGKVVGSDDFASGLLGRFLFAVEPDTVLELDDEAPSMPALLDDADGELAQVIGRLRTMWNYVHQEDGCANMDEAAERFRLEAREAAELERMRTSRKQKERESAWNKPDVKVSILHRRQTSYCYSPASKAAFDALKLWTRAEKARSDHDERLLHLAIWGRTVELAKRIAELLAAYRTLGTDGPHEIADEEAEWAMRAVEASTRAGLGWYESFAAKGGEEARRSNQLLQVLRDLGGWVAPEKIKTACKMRKLRMDKGERETCLSLLEKAGLVKKRVLSGAAAGGPKPQEWTVTPQGKSGHLG